MILLHHGRYYASYWKDLGGWSVEVLLEHKDGRIVITRVALEPNGDADVLGTQVLKRFRLGDLHDEIREGIRQKDVSAVLPDSWFDSFLARPRPGRAGRPDREYAVWARRYVRAQAEAPGREVKHLTEKFGGTSEATLRAILNKARSRGLLTKSEPGKAGGKLTKKAERLLAGLVEED